MDEVGKAIMGGKEKLYAAISALQGELPKVDKGKTAKVRSDKGNYEYTYAGLAEVSEKVLPLLSKHGLAFVATPRITERGYVLIGKLTCGSEGEIGEFPLPGQAGPQAIGSAITYGRRYLLCALTGLVADDQDDDAGAAEQEVKRTRRAASASAEKAGEQDAKKQRVLGLVERARNATDKDDPMEELRRVHAVAKAGALLGQPVEVAGQMTTLGEFLNAEKDRLDGGAR